MNGLTSLMVSEGYGGFETELDDVDDSHDCLMLSEQFVTSIRGTFRYLFEI